MNTAGKKLIKGDLVDTHTRCSHYHSLLDIIAIKFKCCEEYYACIHCHEKHAGHEAEVWGKNERNTKAVLCGNCQYEMSINEYLSCGYECPNCKTGFNPKCGGHDHFYFEGDGIVEG